MTPSDLRKQNLVIDETCTVRGKLVAQNADIADTTIQTTAFSAPTIQTQTLQAQNIVANGSSIPTPDFLFTQTPNSIMATNIPEFTTNGSAEIKSVLNTAATSVGALDYLFMSGSDGNQTISTTQSLVRDTYFDTLTITPTGILNPNGFVVFCKTALINHGSVLLVGSDGGAGAGGIGGAFGVAAPNGTVFGGSTGASGGNTNVNGFNMTTSQVFGGLGGTGGSSDTKIGGTSTATTVRYFNAPTPIRHLALFPEIFRLLVAVTGTNMLGFIPGLGGGGGAGGSLGAGGGGGASGGLIVICAKTVSGTGTIDVRGGAGGNGQVPTGGGGGGGGGGVVYVMARNNLLNLSQILISGGAGGVGGGAGGQDGAVGNPGLYQNNVVPA